MEHGDHVIQSKIGRVTLPRRRLDIAAYANHGFGITGAPARNERQGKLPRIFEPATERIQIERCQLLTIICIAYTKQPNLVMPSVDIFHLFFNDDAKEGRRKIEHSVQNGVQQKVPSQLLR